ncbi:RdgB/HAM1 family non-canonical purine NTP pyrophosphatase [bacterium]|nr:RdgB/HAM1 family non-canonical purine NTP pyrophosphatase [bacterium]
MKPKMILLIATNNRHKIEELRDILIATLGDDVVELKGADAFPDVVPPEETGETFEANAIIKARAYAKATGLLTLADDSGLVVDALDGRPGVQSARYGPNSKARNERVLNEMARVPAEQRTARFVCVAALVDPKGKTQTRTGTVEGKITFSPRGDNGFGYDPIFELVEQPYVGFTTAQLTSNQKNSISHRGRALRAIAPLVSELIK